MLTRQTRNQIAAMPVRPVAGGAGRDVLVGNAILENLPARFDQISGPSAAGEAFSVTQLLCYARPQCSATRAINRPHKGLGDWIVPRVLRRP